MQLSEQQVNEWKESQVTEALKAKIETYSGFVRSAEGIDAYHPFDPQRTQEILAGLNAIVDTLELVLEWLEGDWDSLELEDDSKESD
jgi:hypothetical protein